MMNSEPELGSLSLHVGRWLESAADPEVGAALEAIYQRCTDRVKARGPACWASGRCCNFDRTGHLLYVTGLEGAYTLVRLEDPLGMEGKAGRTGLAILGERGPACVFQRGNLCSVHAVRPLGCRVYFCDRSAQAWQNEMYEELQRDLRVLHDRLGIEYRYVEWRLLLREFSVFRSSRRS